MYLQKGLHRHTVVTIRSLHVFDLQTWCEKLCIYSSNIFHKFPQLGNFWIHEYWFLCYLAQENSSQNYLFSRYVNLGINIKVNFRQISFCVVNYTISYAFGTCIYTGGTAENRRPTRFESKFEHHRVDRINACYVHYTFRFAWVVKSSGWDVQVNISHM